LAGLNGSFLDSDWVRCYSHQLRNNAYVMPVD
jgi:hypothetical protein